MAPRVWEVEGVPPPTMKATEEEMAKARLPHSYRDYCSHLLIKLNECRQKSKFAPWACKHEKHDYMMCQYVEFYRRQQIVKTMLDKGQPIPDEWAERWDPFHTKKASPAASDSE